MVTGYPPEDLLLRPGFVRAAQATVAEIAAATHDMVALVGAPHLDTDLYNACYVLADGEIRGVYRKHFLPNYGVFDEDRYFAPGEDLLLLRFGDVLVGPTICEDIWQPGPPATDLALAGAHLVANLSASPFHVGKDREREDMLRVRARDNACFVALCNAVGAQDELIFDGHSIVIDDEGEVVARAPGFEEVLLVVDLDPAASVGRRLRDIRRRSLRRARGWIEPPVELELPPPREQQDVAHGTRAPELADLEQMRLALELGLRDYVDKNRFSHVVVGLSGGIDSALTAALAVEALGADRVHGVSMPSRFSSEGTRGDAGRLADALGIDFREIPIEPAVEVFAAALAPSFEGRAPDLTEENLQARIRGILLMALSNKFGWLVVTTGNKSEMSVGYATLYGDMAGGFALLKDVYKTDVFRLSSWLNERAGRELIPQSIIDRPPSAELREDQRDDQSLPPYDELDRVLEAYVELDRSRDELTNDGFDPGVVERALAMIDRAEYKRRQAPPGVKLHPKAFGRDRRTPITNRWPG
jgi:NAD+ synthase (glutamine-hydrolysing)